MASLSKITIDGTKYAFRDETFREGIETKQDKLTAGENIVIDENNVISVKKAETTTTEDTSSTSE